MKGSYVMKKITMFIEDLPDNGTYSVPTSQELLIIEGNKLEKSFQTGMEIGKTMSYFDKQIQEAQNCCCCEDCDSEDEDDVHSVEILDNAIVFDNMPVPINVIKDALKTYNSNKKKNS